MTTRSLVGDRGVQVERVDLAWQRTLISLIALQAIVGRSVVASECLAVQAVAATAISAVLARTVRRRMRALKWATHRPHPSSIGAGLLAIVCGFASLSALAGAWCLL